MMVMMEAMRMMVQARIGIEDQLEVDAGGRERDLGVTFTAAVLEANLALLLRPVTESCVADLQAKIDLLSFQSLLTLIEQIADRNLMFNGILLMTVTSEL